MIKLFFLSTGRCGTMSTAKHFNFEHEPDNANPSLENLAKRIEQAKKRGVYGETSNFWRLKLDELKEAHKDAFFIHLVRHPRKVIKSMLPRQMYTGGFGKASYNEQKLPVAGFKRMNRHQKICSYVKYWNEYIEERINLRIRLEDIADVLPVHNETPANDWTSILNSDYNEEEYQEILGDMAKRYGYTN